MNFFQRILQKAAPIMSAVQSLFFYVIIFSLTGYYIDQKYSISPFGIIIEYSGSAPDSNSDSANQAILFYDSSGSSRFLVAGDGDCQNHDNDFGAISDERIKDSIVFKRCKNI